MLRNACCIYLARFPSLFSLPEMKGYLGKYAVRLMNSLESENHGREEAEEGRVTWIKRTIPMESRCFSYETRIEKHVVQSLPLCMNERTNDRQVARGNQLNVKAQLTESYDWGTYSLVEQQVSHHPLVTVN